MYRVTWTTEGRNYSHYVATLGLAEYLRAAILRSDPAAIVSIEPA